LAGFEPVLNSRKPTGADPNPARQMPDGGNNSDKQ